MPSGPSALSWLWLRNLSLSGESPADNTTELAGSDEKSITVPLATCYAKDKVVGGDGRGGGENENENSDTEISIYKVANERWRRMQQVKIRKGQMAG